MSSAEERTDLAALLPRAEQMAEELNAMLDDPETTEDERDRADRLLVEITALAAEIKRRLRS